LDSGDEKHAVRQFQAAASSWLILRAALKIDLLEFWAARRHIPFFVEVSLEQAKSDSFNWLLSDCSA
jgi:hypothetical protein